MHVCVLHLGRGREGGVKVVVWAGRMAMIEPLVVQRAQALCAQAARSMARLRAKPRRTLHLNLFSCSYTREVLKIKKFGIFLIQYIKF